MAYVFDRLRQQLDPAESQKQDIFASETGQQGIGLTGAQPTTGQLGDPVKTDASLSLTGPAAGSSRPSQDFNLASQQQPRGASEQRQQALESSRAQLPRSLESLGSSLEEGEKNLASAHKGYLSGFRQQDFGLDPETVGSAAKGDQASLDKVTGLLSRSSPGNIESFTAPDVSVPEIDAIQTAGGLQQYLRRQAGPQYTAGEGSFDAASFGRDPLFEAGRADLARRQAALETKADTLGMSSQQQANQILADNLAAAQGDVRGDLGTRRTTLGTALDQRAESAFEDLGTIPEGIREQAMQGLAERGLTEAQAGDLDFRDFVTTRTDPFGRSDVATPEEIARFNRLTNLLGAGGDALVSSPTSPSHVLDSQAYVNAVQDQVDAQAEADAVAQAQAEADAVAQAEAETAAKVEARAQKARSDRTPPLPMPAPAPAPSPITAPGSLNIPTTQVNTASYGNNEYGIPALPPPVDPRVQGTGNTVGTLQLPTPVPAPSPTPAPSPAPAVSVPAATPYDWNRIININRFGI